MAFFWHEFCDWYLELKKLRLEDNTGLNAHWRNLLTVYEMALRLLHPLMPFLTEELWQRIAEGAPDRPQSHRARAHIRSTIRKLRTRRPKYEMEILQAIVTAARELRADMKIDPKATMDGVLVVRERAVRMIGREAAADREAGRSQAGSSVNGRRRSKA